MTLADYLHERYPDAYKQLSNDPKVATLLNTQMPPSDDDFDRHMMMARLIHNRVPGYRELIAPVTDFFGGLIKKGLDLRSVPDNAVPRRPPEAGLPQTINTMSQARLRFGGTKLASLNTNPHELRDQVSHICALRETAAPVAALLRALMRNLAVLEDKGYTDVKKDFEIIRSMVQADPELDFMENLEKYFYGSAEKGAETRRDNRRTFEDMTVKAQQKGQADANRKARTNLAEEFEGLIQDFRRTDPNGGGNDDDKRNTPR